MVKNYRHDRTWHAADRQRLFNFGPALKNGNPKRRPLLSVSLRFSWTDKPGSAHRLFCGETAGECPARIEEHSLGVHGHFHVFLHDWARAVQTLSLGAAADPRRLSDRGEATRCLAL